MALRFDDEQEYEPCFFCEGGYVNSTIPNKFGNMAQCPFCKGWGDDRLKYFETSKTKIVGTSS